MTTFLDYLSLNETGLNLLNKSDVMKACHLIENTAKNNGVIWTAGNGGSASTASHAQCDLSKGVSESAAINIRAVCLNDLMPLLSAWENDFGHEEAIVNICKTHVQINDLLLLISGSGNSSNIINAANWARENNIQSITLTGFDGGRLRSLGTCSIHVPIQDMQVVENLHLVIIHYFLKFFEK